MSKKDELTLDIEELKVKDMTKSELLALVERQDKALKHSEHVKEQDDKLLESMRENFVTVQKETEKDFEDIQRKTVSLISAFTVQKQGMIKVLDGLIDLATWDDILKEKQEEE